MEIQNEFKKAINFFQKGNYNEAKKIYEQILVEKSDFPEIHYNLGIVLKILNNLEEAEKSFERAISLKSDFVHAHYHMGNTKYKLKKFDESEFSYKKAINLKSDFIEAYINLSRAQKELGKLGDAEENARIALKINPNFPDSNMQLSSILFERGRPSDDLKNQNIDKLIEAKENILKTIKQKPYDSLAFLNHGVILQELGDLNIAKESFEKSLELDPNSELAKYNLDILLKQTELLKKIGIDINKKTSNLHFKKEFNKIPFISYRKPNRELIDLLYKINSTELNKTKGGPLFGNGKTSDYQLFDKDNLILKNVKEDLIKIIKDEIKSDVFIIDSFFNILGSGGGSVPHHHLNSFDNTFKLSKQKFSLTYYLSVGDQNCKEPGIFKIYEPNEEILPSNGMIMIIPSSRKHSAVYEGNLDRVMIGLNFYCYN
jgi:tetratricopeptide (TPR) repeat protein